jgi:phage terminase small subunit
MALPGPKPRPLHDKINEGNKSNRPLIPLLDQPPDGDLVMPPEVYDDMEAKRYWVHYVTTTAMNHLKPCDGPILAELCLTLSILASANRELAMYMEANEGRVTCDSGRNFTQHPAIRIKLASSEKMIKLLVQLQLTPAERNRVWRKDSGNDADAGEESMFDDQLN